LGLQGNLVDEGAQNGHGVLDGGGVGFGQGRSLVDTCGDEGLCVNGGVKPGHF
jgi:hypothetical protein